jgi:thiol-disulfide isomerase/thioredoxin
MMAAVDSKPRSDEPNARGTLGTALAIFVGVGAVVAYSRLMPSETERLRGKEAPDFTLAIVANGNAANPLAGTEKMHLAETRGKPVVLDFWASWCGPCKKEAPILQRLSEKYAGRVTFAAVNTSDDLDGAIGGSKSFGIRFPVVYDADKSVAQRFAVQSLPTLIVIGKDGKIHAVRIGTTDEKELAGLIDETL